MKVRKEDRKKNRYFYVCAILVLTISLQLWFSYINFHFPFLGIEVKKIENYWTVTNVDKEGLGFHSGVTSGDRILQIDNNETINHFTVKKWGHIEQAKHLLFERSGVTLELIFDYSMDTSYRHFIIPFLLGAICIAISIFLILKASNHMSASNLALVFLTVGLILISVGASGRGDVVGKFIVSNAVIILPILFYRFILVFLIEKKVLTLPYKWLKYIYAVLLVILSVRVSYFFPVPYNNIFYYDRFFTLLFFVLGIILNISFLLIQFKEKKTAVIVNLKFLLFSVTLSFVPMIIFSIIPAMLSGSPWIEYMYTGIFVFVFPIIFLYLLISKRLYDIQMFINRSIYIITLSILPAILVTLTVIIMTYKFLSFAQYFFLFCLTILIFASLYLIQERFQEAMEATLFPEKYRLRTSFQSMVNEMGKVSGFSEIENNILEKLSQILRIKGAAILLQSSDGTKAYSYGNIQSTQLSDLVSNNGNPKEDLDFSFYKIYHDQTFSNYLVLARKEDNTHFSIEEERWINWLNSYFVVLLEKLYLIEKLSMKISELVQRNNENESQDILWLRKVMDQLQDKERERISIDLHDTALQDIYFAKQQLGLLLDRVKKHIDDKEIIEKFSDIIEHLELINTGLRDTCFQLYPHTLAEAGLINSLKLLFQTEKMRVPFTIHLEIDDTVIEKLEGFVMEKKASIFRIIQELLINAKKHSEATELYFTFRENIDCLELEYRDNGKGFQNIEQSDRISMGLMQIRNRLAIMDGCIDIDLDCRAGVLMVIKIPN